MSFRKRNQLISGNIQRGVINRNVSSQLPGSRTSPIDGRTVTSTGVPSLDNVLAGHGGLATGNCLLVEENGTTDYAGTLIKLFAAEGVAQGHRVHVVGMPEAWGRTLPGIVEEGEYEKKNEAKKEKMKIAWRYEGLGEVGVTPAGRRVERDAVPDVPLADQDEVFCHTFDLTKRLSHPEASKISYVPLTPAPTASPFASVLEILRTSLAASSIPTIHRLVIPSILSPILYAGHASNPEYLLSFFHGLRSLLRQFASHLVILITVPLSLHPRSSVLIRWLEHLVDGVLELAPFSHSTASLLSTSGASTSQEDKPQGLMSVHKLPIFHERGGGGAGVGLRAFGEDLAFTVSRRKFAIKPFSLPPADGDLEAQVAKGSQSDGKAMDF